MLNRIKNLSNYEVTQLLGFTPTNEIGREARELLNLKLLKRIEEEEIDEIELIIIESGN